MKRIFGLSVFAACVLAAALGLAACGSSNSYRITVREGDEDLVWDVPERAEAGETVTITTAVVCDADLYVSVNGDREFGHFTRDGSYEFVMPEEDVEIAVVIISNGLA